MLCTSTTINTFTILISLILGCSITFFIIYIVYRIRSVFILKRKSHSKLKYSKQNLNHDEQSKLHQDKNPLSNGHCHINEHLMKKVMVLINNYLHHQ